MVVRGGEQYWVVVSNMMNIVNQWVRVDRGGEGKERKGKGIQEDPTQVPKEVAAKEV